MTRKNTAAASAAMPTGDGRGMVRRPAPADRLRANHNTIASAAKANAASQNACADTR